MEAGRTGRNVLVEIRMTDGALTSISAEAVVDIANISAETADALTPGEDSSSFLFLPGFS